MCSRLESLTRNSQAQSLAISEDPFVKDEEEMNANKVESDEEVLARSQSRIPVVRMNPTPVMVHVMMSD